MSTTPCAGSLPAPPGAHAPQKLSAPRGMLHGPDGGLEAYVPSKMSGERCKAANKFKTPHEHIILGEMAVTGQTVPCPKHCSLETQPWPRDGLSTWEKACPGNRAQKEPSSGLRLVAGDQGNL